eukprot:Clim_evm18s149 gene=Clim_evmTU18s149
MFEGGRPYEPVSTMDTGSFLTTPSTTEAKRFTPKEVKDSTDLYVLDGNVYDLTDFYQHHPGGDTIRWFAADDITVAYYSIHASHIKKSPVLEKYKVGVISKPLETDLWEMRTPFAKELRANVMKKLKSLPDEDPQFAPTWVYFRACIIMAVCLLLDYSWIFQGVAMWKALAIGWIFALIGLNIQHDANHGAFSRKSWVNVALGYTQDYIGGSRMLWLRQHTVGHHVHTSHDELDPDVLTGKGLLILHENYVSDRKYYQIFQHIYTWFLLNLLGISWLILDVRNILTMKVGGVLDVNRSLYVEKWISVIFRIGHFLRYFGVAVYQTGSILTAAYYIMGMSAVAGCYLGFFFILSHNFDEAIRVDSKEDKNGKRDWCKAQIESSSNVGGFGLLVLNGGLNYQIEHHLFPRVSSSRYWDIAPVVRETCEKHGVRYVHFPSIWDNFKSTVTFLWRMGRGEVKAKTH